MSTIGKTRHAAASGHRSVDRSASPVRLALSDSDDDPEKENYSKGNAYRNKSLIESSDDDFDQCEWVELYEYSILSNCVTQVVNTQICSFYLFIPQF